MFPLPLTTFERYMWSDDQSDYPMTFTIALELSGGLQREPLEAAFAETLERHPLLRACVHWSWRRGLEWRSAAERPRLDWCDLDGPVACAEGARIDLRREPGLRAFVRPCQAGHRLVAQFHHAATDGLGALSFLGDWLAHYGRRTVRTGQAAPVPVAIDPGLLRHRGLLTMPDCRDPECTPLKGNLPGVRRFTGRRVVPLASAASRPVRLSDPTHVPGFVTRTLDKLETRAIKSFAARRLVTSNDVCLASMFAALARWNGRHGQLDPNASLRITVPVSLRTPLHDGIPAANVVSYLFLTRPSTLEVDDAFLGRLNADAQAKVLGGRGPLFLKSLRTTFLVPGLVPFLLRGNSCWSSLVMTNVGDIRRQLGAEFPLEGGKCVAGNVVLESIGGTPPVRRKTRAVVCLSTYAGRMAIDLRCDPRHFQAADADEFLDVFVGQLRSWIASAGEEAAAA